MKVAKSPNEPTQEEVDEHCVTHLPYRSWCPVCVKARGREEPHKKGTKKGEKPIVSMDYKVFGESATEDDKITSIIIKDESTGSVAAHQYVKPRVPVIGGSWTGFVMTWSCWDIVKLS